MCGRGWAVASDRHKSNDKRVALILKCGGENTVRNSPDSAGDQIMVIMIVIRTWLSVK